MIELKKKKMRKRTYDDMIEAMKKDLHGYQQNIFDAKKILELYINILTHLQSSNKIHFHKNEKIINESNKLESVEQWMHEYLGNTEIYSNVVDSYEKEVFKPLNTLYIEFENILKTIDNVVEDANMRLDTAESCYSQYYNEYLEKCHAIEAEQDYHLVEKMKTECSELEKQCIDYTLVLAKSRRHYCFEIEVLFIDYERIVEKYYKTMQSLLVQLPVNNSIFTHHFQAIKLNEDMLQGSIVEHKINEQHKSLQKLQFESPSVELDYDIFNYIDPNTVYDTVLTVIVYEIKEKYQDEYKTFCLNPGDYATFISRKSKMITVEIVGSGFICDLPLEILQKSHYKRSIMVLKEDWEELGMKIPAGSPLCVCKEYDKCKICLTPSLTYLHIPDNRFVV